jgi:hypothetical protein
MPHILFIASVSFICRADIIRKRLGSRRIVFLSGPTSAQPASHFLPLAKSVDFIEYGFESEFIGRLPVIVSCQDLRVEDLFEILKHSEGSIVRQYVQAFEAYNIDLKFTDEGLLRLAQRAALEHTGARSLVSVCEQTFREFKYQLPHSPVRTLEVTAELVDDPKGVLAGILSRASEDAIATLEKLAVAIAEEWSRGFGIEIEMQPEAARLLAQKALETDQRIEAVFAETFKNYEHGLSLIRQTRKAGRFEITPEVIRDPDGTLDRWIRSYYVPER